MILLLRVLFTLVLVAMFAVAISATLESGVFEAAGELGSDPWFRVTLAEF